MEPDQIKTELQRISEGVKNTLAETKTRLDDIEQKMVREPGPGYQAKAALSFDPLLKHPSLEAFARKAVNSTERIQLPFGIKALVNSGSDPDSNSQVFYTPEQRLGIVSTVLRPLRLVDVMRSIPVASNIVEYVRLSYSGSAAAQENEGDLKARMTFDSDLVESRIATIAVLADVSLQVIADNAALQAELERIMRHQVLSELEVQLITGSGTGGRIDGLYTQVSELNSNRDPFPERIGDVLQQMETDGFMPNVILMHPTDWFEISMLKNADGDYIYGNPASPARPTLFNRPVVVSSSIPLHRALIGDTNEAPILDREQPTIAISYENKDNFERNLATIRVELRAGLALYNTGAFRKVSLDPRS